MSTKESKATAKGSQDVARGPYKPAALLELTGMTQTNYDSWRRSLPGAPSGHFTDGDVLAYAVINFLVTIKRVTLPYLRNLEHPDTSFIFTVCNHSFSALSGYQIMYDWTANRLFLHSKTDVMPDIDPYDLAKVDLDELIEAHNTGVTKGFDKRNNSLIDNDTFELAKLKRQSQKEVTTG